MARLFAGAAFAARSTLLASRTGTIHNDGFETLAGEFANGGVSGVTVLDCDLKLAENAAQDAHRFLIGAYE
jgi:hypothetical protein